GMVPRLLTAVWVQLRYALLFVWPHPLSCDYSFDVIPIARSLLDPRFLAGLAFLAFAVAAIIWGRRHSRPVALAALPCLVFFLPSSNPFFPAGTIMAERLAYLPSLGLCLMTGHLGASWSARGRKEATTILVTSILAIAAVSVLTWQRNAVWKD